MKKRAKELENQGLSNTRWKQIFQQGKTKVGLIIVLLFIIAAVFAPVLAPNNPLLVDVAHKLEGPSRSYLLGTDQLGRCILSRLIWGSRYSLLYSGIVLLLTLLIGVPIGLISGYVGGKLDLFIMRIIDIFMAMPSFIVALAIAGTLGASGRNLVIAMSCVYWAAYARLTRALTMQLKEQNYMLALKAGGCSHGQIIFKHVLKNISPSIIALATIEIGSIILAIAGFSFIGLGVQPPVLEWGIMLSDSQNFIQTYPRLMMYPGIVIVIVVMAFNLLGDGMKNGMSAK
ncbi:ABC transporter permease subunit [Ruminococcus sp. OA3]|uniref:ABC transporter permease n=1 Tax=Ruminococcus sp. OA3 TaxID=2914164 RepID=UPI001F060156|nr:ABC transporter permease subunit [Ruminococcus sp. OA3]MCH1983421.1 ABC transporter permease subunit [Ruminococcus sp. OA3]